MRVASRVLNIVALGGYVAALSPLSSHAAESCPVGWPQATADWTVMIYMAAQEEALEECADLNLAEMVASGSTARVHMIVQVDRASTKGGRRYRIVGGKYQELQDLVDDPLDLIPEPDTGNPGSLKRFVDWARTCFPASHEMLVIWGHSHGVGYGLVARCANPEKHAKCAAPEPTWWEHLQLLPLDPHPGGIHLLDCCYDKHDTTWLTTGELVKVLDKAYAGSKLDILGFDACYMGGSAEMAYEVRKSVHYVLGSQTGWPLVGWPYAALLAKLAAKPTTTPEEIGRHVVGSFAAKVALTDPPETNTTLTLIDASRAAGLKDALGELTAALSQAYEGAAGNATALAKLGKPFRGAAWWGIRQFLDVRDLCKQLQGPSLPPRIRKAAVALDEVLRSPKGMLVAHEGVGDKVARLSGATLYYSPLVDAQACKNVKVEESEYKALQLVKETGWAALSAKVTQLAGN